jgi:hypothetical protein
MRIEYLGGRAEQLLSSGASVYPVRRIKTA